MLALALSDQLHDHVFTHGHGADPKDEDVSAVSNQFLNDFRYK
jgi:hypothetical protein